MKVEALTHYGLSFIVHALFVLIAFSLFPKSTIEISVPLDFSYEFLQEPTHEKREETKEIETEQRGHTKRKDTAKGNYRETVSEEPSSDRVTPDERVDLAHAATASSYRDSSSSGHINPLSSDTMIARAVPNVTIDKAKIIGAFMRRIEELKFYPYLARRKGIEGVVVVLVHLDRNGEALNIILRSSSGYEILDRSALELVRKACPFRHEYDRELQIEIPIKYKLTN